MSTHEVRLEHEHGHWRWLCSCGSKGIRLCYRESVARLAAKHSALNKRDAPHTLFQQGNFELHSGEVSCFKIDCDALTDEDIRTLAMMLAQRLPPFGTVEGVPTGGTRIADALRGYARSGHERRGTFGARELLIVDDVWTTGASMEAHRAGRDAIGAVIFARYDTAGWVTPLFTLDA